MSIQFGKLCSLILLENFGEIVEKVGRDLFRGGQKTLKLICASTRVNIKKVRQALCILIQYEIVSFVPGRLPTTAEYKLQPENILRLLQFPKYLMLAKTMYGSEAEIIVEEILRHGSDNIRSILLRSYHRVVSNTGSENSDNKPGEVLMSLRTTFEMLVNKQYIGRCPALVGSDDAVPTPVLNPQLEFNLPQVDLAQLVQATVQPSTVFNDSVVWSVRRERFLQDLRDDLLVTAITRRVSPPAGQVMRLLLQQMHLNSAPWVAVSNPVMVAQLKEVARKNKMDAEMLRHLEEHLVVIAEDPSNFVCRADLTQLSYQVNLKEAIEELTWTVLSTAVDVKFGTNAARIFRLIRQQEFIEQEEVQKRAMLPDKEAKLLTYSLLHAGWIQQHELKKGLQKAGPTKTFFLFCIDAGHVVRMHMETCYKCLYNLMTRRDHERMENKGLLDKKQRVDTIALHLRSDGATQDQIDEIEEMVTPPERQLLDKIQLTVGKLSQAELQVDETLFILQLYLMMRA